MPCSVEFGSLARDVDMSSQYVPLWKDGHKLVQYEGFLFNRTPDKALDNDIRSCADTAVGNGSWWRIELPHDVIVNEVVVQTGTTFGCELDHLSHLFKLETKCSILNVDNNTI